MAREAEQLKSQSSECQLTVTVLLNISVLWYDVIISTLCMWYIYTCIYGTVRVLVLTIKVETHQCNCQPAANTKERPLATACMATSMDSCEHNTEGIIINFPKLVPSSCLFVQNDTYF